MPLEIESACPPSGKQRVAIQWGVGRGLNPSLPGVSGEVSWDDVQAIPAIGEICERTYVGDPEFDVVQIIDTAVGSEDLIHYWHGWILHIDDHQPLLGPLPRKHTFAQHKRCRPFPD